MAEQTMKQTFLLKMILGTMLATYAGGVIASVAEYSFRDLSRFSHFLPGFIYTFFPLVCVVAIQWLLLSDYLPKQWTILGFIGSLIAGMIVGLVFWTITNETYNLYKLEIEVFNAIVAGTLLALPQWIILRDKRGYLWVLSNVLGLTINHVGLDVIMSFPDPSEFYFTLERILTLVLPVPFGLMLGLYLYKYVYSAKDQRIAMSKNI